MTSPNQLADQIESGIKTGDGLALINSERRLIVDALRALPEVGVLKNRGTDPAWDMVVAALNKAVPGWLIGKGTGAELAVKAIERLSQNVVPEAPSGYRHELVAIDGEKSEENRHHGFMLTAVAARESNWAPDSYVAKHGGASYGTPRTDALLKTADDSHDFVAFSRQLERELTDAKALIARLEMRIEYGTDSSNI
jgi:hypothetical protein